MLKIEKVNIYEISLTFTGDFSNSRKQGAYSDNVVVEIVTDKDRVTGYGEGAPVEFVTGETQKSTAMNAIRFVKMSRFPWELKNIAQLWDYIDSLPVGMENNAAICAIETAILDALGKYEKKSVLSYFPHDYYTSSINYGGAITLGDEARIKQLCRLIKSLAIKDLRIKLGRDFEQNRMSIGIVREIFGNDPDLRVDPNGVWDKELALKHLPLILQHKVKIVEEPMNPYADGFRDVAQILRNNKIILMACDSAPTMADVQRIIDEGQYQMINVKICRSGGFRRSLKIIELIREEGLLFQIGCNVGESGILSAAGRALCLLCSDALYYDGSYNKFILSKNITKEHVSFGPGGKAGPLPGFGLGVEVSRESLSELTKNVTTIREDV